MDKKEPLEICRTCTAFHDLRPQGHTGGECRVSPPVVLPSGETRFPEVEDTMWCKLHLYNDEAVEFFKQRVNLQ